mgnify:CR=1 FL=1
MRKLQRGIAPTCLNQYQPGQNNWGSVSSGDKALIWTELDAMQGKRCAYCEADISGNNKHIEHFRQRSRYPQGTFAWDNLFGSCNRKDSCGKHKDEQAAPYSDADLLKPDTEDPESLLVFDPNGGVSPRKGLSPQDTQRASETIRVFNLDGVLKAIRRSELAGYIRTAEFFAEMAQDFPEAEWSPLLQEEIDNTTHLPFSTAIKHVLTRQSAIA